MTASTESSMSAARQRSGNRGRPAGAPTVRWAPLAPRGHDRVGAVRGSRDRRARLRAHLSAARAAAGALLALAALLALPAHAQTTVSADWGGIPAGVAAGTPFRLLFVTSTGIACTSTDIATYNSHVQGRAGVHPALSGHSARFKAVASTSAVDAKDNTGTSGSTAAIYWLGGAKAADNNADFYDGTLDSYAGKTETGGSVSSTTRIWTGSENNGVKFGFSGGPLGGDSGCQIGLLRSGKVLANSARSDKSEENRLYGLSSVFQALAAPAAITNLAAMAGVGKVTLSWSEPDNGGSSITGYDYRQRISSGTNWDPDWTALPSNREVTGLDGGTSYTFEVRAKNAEGNATESNQDTATPLLPEMSIADARAAEGAGSIRFAVTLNATYHEAATANWSTSDDTATAGSDYTAVSSGTLTIAAESTSANITVTVTDDTTDEKAEQFTVTLTGPSHATLSGATATGTIADDDLSTVSIAAGSMAVTEGSPAVFVLSRGIADDGSLAVNLSSSATGDFITATLPTSETIPGGAMSKTLSIATVDDAVTEGDGSVTVTIQTNSGYTVGTASATVNIRDNDASYLLNLAGGGMVSEGAGTVSFTVTLSESSPTEAITVQWATVEQQGVGLLA